MTNAMWVGKDASASGSAVVIPTYKYWQSRLFTTSGTWTVPADVGVIWIDGCAGGGGGGGGFGSATTGGGGGGGASGTNFVQYCLPTTPGETLTITIGAGGGGGDIGAASPGCPATTVVGALAGLYCSTVNTGVGRPGTAALGGSAGGYGANAIVGTAIAGASGIAVGVDTVLVPSYSPRYVGVSTFAWNSGAAGGGPGYAGGASSLGAGFFSTNRYAVGGTPSGTAGSGLGGGGGGGHGLFGDGGAGGNAGVAGSNATGYGAGGGGGGCNAAGGNGSPGMIRIYCFSATTI